MSNILWYKTSFASEDFSVSSWKDCETSKASLENLRPLLPDVDLSRNIDLLSIAANGANPNMINKNDDGIDSKTAVQIIDLLINKPINVEHQSKKIVGHILTSGFTEMGSSTIISAKDAAEADVPINISFGGVIYRKIHPELAKLLEESTDPQNKFFKSVSTSWEISFSDFHIVLGSRIMKDAEIVSDPKQVKELKKYLRKYGGPGKLKDGTPVYRKVLGANVLPVGFGLVAKPAAFVSSLITAKPEKASAARTFADLFKKN